MRSTPTRAQGEERKGRSCTIRERMNTSTCSKKCRRPPGARSARNGQCNMRQRTLYESLRSRAAGLLYYAQRAKAYRRRIACRPANSPDISRYDASHPTRLSSFDSMKTPAGRNLKRWGPCIYRKRQVVQKPCARLLAQWRRLELFHHSQRRGFAWPNRWGRTGLSRPHRSRDAVGASTRAL